MWGLCLEEGEGLGRRVPGVPSWLKAGSAKEEDCSGLLPRGIGGGNATIGNLRVPTRTAVEWLVGRMVARQVQQPCLLEEFTARFRVLPLRPAVVLGAFGLDLEAWGHWAQGARGARQERGRSRSVREEADQSDSEEGW